MPIERVKKKVKKAAKKVRRHWSYEEKQRRADMAEVMQMQLLTALGFQPAPAVRK
ncbi:MAG: hypothetical protein AAGD11_11090 [Planctomycetota bacterium]